MTRDIAERIQQARLFVQDCIDVGHDRGMIGNLLSARDELDAVIRDLERRRRAAPIEAGQSSPSAADKRLTDFCEQLSQILVKAGRMKADCIVPISGPVISFGKWTERSIRSHPDVFLDAFAKATAGLDATEEQVRGIKRATPPTPSPEQDT